MNFTKFIENLQNKPKIVRIQILIGAVFICMVFISWVWIESLKLSQPTQTGPEGIEQATTKSSFEQLEKIGKESFKSLEEFKKEFESLKEKREPEQEKAEPVRLPIEQ